MSCQQVQVMPVPSIRGHSTHQLALDLELDARCTCAHAFSKWAPRCQWSLHIMSNWHVCRAGMHVLKSHQQVLVAPVLIIRRQPTYQLTLALELDARCCATRAVERKNSSVRLEPHALMPPINSGSMRSAVVRWHLHVSQTTLLLCHLGL